MLFRSPHIENLRAVWAGGAGLAPAAWLAGGRVCGREGAETVPTLADLLGYGVHPLAVRAWLLSTSYHKPLCAAPEALAMWERNRARIQELAAGLTLAAGEGQPADEAAAAAEGLEAALEAALAEDLSVAHFWPTLFAFARQANAGLASGTLGGADAARHLAALAAADAVLGLLDPAGLPLSRPNWPAEAARLIEARASARAARDFARADALRRDVEAMGLRLEDASEGARLFPARPIPEPGKS